MAKALGVLVHRLYGLLRKRKLGDGSAVVRSSHDARRLAEQRRREKRQAGGG